MWGAMLSSGLRMDFSEDFGVGPVVTGSAALDVFGVVSDISAVVTSLISDDVGEMESITHT